MNITKYAHYRAWIPPRAFFRKNLNLYSYGDGQDATFEIQMSYFTKIYIPKNDFCVYVYLAYLHLDSY